MKTDLTPCEVLGIYQGHKVSVDGTQIGIVFWHSERSSWVAHNAERMRHDLPTENAAIQALVTDFNAQKGSAS